MHYVNVLKGHVTPIGYQTENDVLVVRIPLTEFSEIREDGGSFSVIYKRPRENAGFPIPESHFRVEGDTLLWDVKAEMLEKTGKGCFQVIYKKGDIQKVSAWYEVEVLPSIAPGRDVPEVWSGWLDQFRELTDRAEAAVELVEDLGADATVDGSTGTPDVEVERETVGDHYQFHFRFSGLKGETDHPIILNYGETYDPDDIISAYESGKIIFLKRLSAPGELTEAHVLYRMSRYTPYAIFFESTKNSTLNIYKDRYADLRAAFGNNSALYYRHYCEYGRKEGRNASLPAVGDQLRFSGGKLYVSASSIVKYVDVPSFIGVVTKIENGSRHPYYITSKSYDGWCDACSLI